MIIFLIGLCAIVFLTPFSVEVPEALNGFVMIAVAAVGAVVQMSAANQAGKAAKSAAKRQAGMYEMQAKEDIRRQKMKNKQLLGRQAAATYASNIHMKGSAAQLRKQTNAEMNHDLMMKKKMMDANIRNIRKGGQAVAQAQQWKAAAAGVEGVGGVWQAGSNEGYWGAGKKARTG